MKERNGKIEKKVECKSGNFVSYLPIKSHTGTFIIYKTNIADFKPQGPE